MRLEDIVDHERLTAEAGDVLARGLASDLNPPSARGAYKADLIRGSTFYAFERVEDEGVFKWQFTGSY